MNPWVFYRILHRKNEITYVEFLKKRRTLLNVKAKYSTHHHLLCLFSSSFLQCFKFLLSCANELHTYTEIMILYIGGYVLTSRLSWTSTVSATQQLFILFWVIVPQFLSRTMLFFPCVHLSSYVSKGLNSSLGVHNMNQL